MDQIFASYDGGGIIFSDTFLEKKVDHRKRALSKCRKVTSAFDIFIWIFAIWYLDYTDLDIFSEEIFDGGKSCLDSCIV
jgi:hypothetical protein